MSYEVLISEAIVDSYFKKLKSALKLDVAIAGAGPSGLVTARYLAEKGLKVAIFEKKLSPGGGIWGGGMLFNDIVVDEEGKKILEEYDVKITKVHDSLYTADSIETTSALIFRALKAGALLFNTIEVEDVVVKNNKVCGFVILWTPVSMTGLHVDPITIEAKACLEATGHPLEVLNVLTRKNDIRLNTSTGSILGERSMHAEIAEKMVVENTGEVFPGLFVSGMAASACHGAPRMGPIFGGMFKSGKKVAKLIADSLKNND